MLPRTNPIDKVDALQSLRPGAAWILKGDNELEWIDTETEAPTEGEIIAEVARLQAEWEAREYARLRDPEYPPMEDFLDAWVKNDAEALNKYREDCLAVKEKYPKPE